MDSKIKEKVAASVTSVEQQGFIKIASLLDWSLDLTYLPQLIKGRIERTTKK
jgi:hypothetical protein